jgi:hypothetical protein
MFDFGLLQQYLPEAEVKQTQSTLGGINLGESDSSTTVQRRSWSGGRSEPDLSAAWLARGSFDHARRAGAGYRKLREHDATKPSRSSAGKSVVRFGPRFLQPVNGAEKPQRPLLLFRFYYCSDFGTFKTAPADCDL